MKTYLFEFNNQSKTLYLINTVEETNSVPSHKPRELNPSQSNFEKLISEKENSLDIPEFKPINLVDKVRKSQFEKKIDKREFESINQDLANRKSKIDKLVKKWVNLVNKKLKETKKNWVSEKSKKAIQHRKTIILFLLISSILSLLLSLYFGITFYSTESSITFIIASILLMSAFTTLTIIMILLACDLKRKKFPKLSEIKEEFGKILTGLIDNLEFNYEGVFESNEEVGLKLKIQEKFVENYPDEFECEVNCSDEAGGAKTVKSMKMMNVMKTKFETDFKNKIKRENLKRAFPARDKSMKTLKTYTFYEVNTKHIENIDKEGEENKDKNLSIKMHSYGKSKPYLTTCKTKIDKAELATRGNPFGLDGEENLELDFDFSSEFD